MSANPAPAPESAPANARGRTVASKPLATSASAASVATSRTRSTGSASAGDKSTRTPSRSSISSSKATASSSVKGSISTTSSRASSRGSESGGRGFKVTKLSSTTVTLPTTWTPRPPQPASTSAPAAPPQTISVAEEPPSRTSDPLQVAAQVYPWTYMTSTLDACFQSAEAAATNDLESRAKELSEEESEIAEQRDRLEAERAIDFFEELGSGAFAKEAPGIMKLFHSHGDSCAQIETEALKLAMRSGPDSDDEEPLKVYNDMLHTLEQLQLEATSLQNSIARLTGSTSSSTEPSPPTATAATDSDPKATSEATADPSNPTAATETSAARSQVSSVFASCLPVLRARIANLSMAQELIDTALENVSLGLRMESMGLA